MYYIVTINRVSIKLVFNVKDKRYALFQEFALVQAHGVHILDLHITSKTVMAIESLIIHVSIRLEVSALFKAVQGVKIHGHMGNVLVNENSRNRNNNMEAIL